MHLKLSGAVVTAAQVPRCKNPKVAKKLTTRRRETKRNNCSETCISSKEVITYHCCLSSWHVSAFTSSHSVAKFPELYHAVCWLCCRSCILSNPRRLLRTERATRASPVPYVPHLPRETKVDVTKSHACHAKCSYMSPSATPATQVQLQLHVSKRHACHASAATCRQAPRLSRLPRETKVDVSKCHACHAKCSYMSPSATPATQKAAASTATAENRARHQNQPSAIRATPATWNEGGCLKVPRLPRKVQLHVAKCRTCHAKSRGVHGDCWEPSAPPEPAQCHTCHACHLKRRWMSQSATPATQSAATYLQVPRLPRKCHACHCVRVSCVCAICVCEQLVCEQVVCVQVLCEQVVWWQVV